MPFSTIWQLRYMYFHWLKSCIWTNHCARNNRIWLWQKSCLPSTVQFKTEYYYSDSDSDKQQIFFARIRYYSPLADRRPSISGTATVFVPPPPPHREEKKLSAKKENLTLFRLNFQTTTYLYNCLGRAVSSVSVGL